MGTLRWTKKREDELIRMIADKAGIAKVSVIDYIAFIYLNDLAINGIITKDKLHREIQLWFGEVVKEEYGEVKCIPYDEIIEYYLLREELYIVDNGFRLPDDWVEPSEKVISESFHRIFED